MEKIDIIWFMNLSENGSVKFEFAYILIQISISIPILPVLLTNDRAPFAM